MVEKMMCIVCNRPLKSEQSKANGYGPKCARRITAKARKEIQEIVKSGMSARIIDDHVIQVEIPVSPEDWGKPLETKKVKR